MILIKSDLVFIFTSQNKQTFHPIYRLVRHRGSCILLERQSYLDYELHLYVDVDIDFYNQQKQQHAPDSPHSEICLLNLICFHDDPLLTSWILIDLRIRQPDDTQSHLMHHR